MTDVEEIAASLTKAQRTILEATSADWQEQRLGPGGFSTLAAFPLMNQGLIEGEYRPPQAMKNRTRYARLTPLGQQVANHLRSTEAREG